MSADEKLGAVQVQFLFGFGVIPGRIATDMTYQHFYLFAMENQLFGVKGAYILAIDVSVNTPEWLEFAELPGQADGTEVAGMPDLVAIPEMIENGIIQEMVRVGNKPDPCQFELI